MEIKKTESVLLPCGKFGMDHNCATCRYADFSDKDSYGRVYCRGGYGGYNYPKDRNGCFHWRED